MLRRRYALYRVPVLVVSAVVVAVRLTRLSQQNKDEPERDGDRPPSAASKPPGAKRGRPQTRTPPTGSAGRSVSMTPSTEGRSNGRSSKTETPSNMANGDSERPVCPSACLSAWLSLTCPPLCRHSPQEDQEDVGFVRLRQSVER